LPARARLDKKISPHTLRHALITVALDAGLPLRDVQQAASHADPRITSSMTEPAPPSTGTPLHRGGVPRRRHVITPAPNRPRPGRRGRPHAGRTVMRMLSLLR
jgi:integrase